MNPALTSLWPTDTSTDKQIICLFLPFLTDHAGPCCSVSYRLSPEGRMRQDGRRLPDHGWPQDLWQRYCTTLRVCFQFLLPLCSLRCHNITLWHTVSHKIFIYIESPSCFPPSFPPLFSRHCVEHRPGGNIGAAESDAERRPDHPLCWAEKGEQGSPRQGGLQGCFTILYLCTCVYLSIVLAVFFFSFFVYPFFCQCHFPFFLVILCLPSITLD